MYGLPQAGKVASDTLLSRLLTAEYKETGCIPSLFKHSTNLIVLALVADDFLVQYTDPAHFTHLANTLEQNYIITTDLQATKFCGITLQCDFKNHHVTLSMPGYIENALQRFTHPAPKQRQHAPYVWILAPNYAAKVQYTPPDDTSIPLDKHGIKKLQEVIRTLLFAEQAVDNTLLVALHPSGRTNRRHQKHNGCPHTIAQLCRNPPRRGHTILQK
jgi:hypothetical protein